MHFLLCYTVSNFPKMPMKTISSTRKFRILVPYTLKFTSRYLMLPQIFWVTQSTERTELSFHALIHVSSNYFKGTLSNLKLFNINTFLWLQIDIFCMHKLGNFESLLLPHSKKTPLFNSLCSPDLKKLQTLLTISSLCTTSSLDILLEPCLL